MISLKNISLRRGKKVLFENVNWTIYHKQRFGIVGENGSGKSSFFSLLLKELHSDTGEVDFPKQIQIAHVAQETPALTCSAIDYTLDGDTELRGLEAQLLMAEEKDDGHLIAVIHEKLHYIDAYSAKSRAAQMLSGLGFSHEEQNKPVSDFSGGWRVRLNLAKALISRSEVLLLDEPTNHLDLDAVIWLEEWLKRYPGTLLLISHDRDFLDGVVDHIAHLEHQEIKVYAGNYSTFEKQRAMNLMLQQAGYEKQQKKIAHLKSFIDRFRAKASKAKQAQSRMKAIEKMELISAVQADSPFTFEFKEPGKCPNPLLVVRDATIAYGEKLVLSHLNISIAPEDRIGLLGPNGAGKSSFIKLLAKELEALAGERSGGQGLKIGYFAQHQVDHLNLDQTPLFHIKQIAEHKKDQELRGFLGSYGFSGDKILEPVKTFSGGEKSRLALALIAWEQPNLLLLDEPTNHLDLEMRQALSMALQAYQGAMILVSHDRFLLKSTVNTYALVADHQLINFEGDLDDYEKWLNDYRRRMDRSYQENNKLEVTRKAQKQLDAKYREERKPYVDQVSQLEKQLEKISKKVSELELILAEPGLYETTQKAELQEKLKLQAKLLEEEKSAEAAWLKACEDLDAFDKKNLNA